MRQLFIGNDNQTQDLVRIRRETLAECLQVAEAAILDNDVIECWNYTAKRIRDKISALAEKA